MASMLPLDCALFSSALCTVFKATDSSRTGLPSLFLSVVSILASAHFVPQSLSSQGSPLRSAPYSTNTNSYTALSIPRIQPAPLYSETCFRITCPDPLQYDSLGPPHTYGIKFSYSWPWGIYTLNKFPQGILMCLETNVSRNEILSASDEMQLSLG